MSEMALKMLLNVLGLSLPLGSEKYTYVKVHNLQLHTYISKGFIINNLYLEILKRFIGIHDKGKVSSVGGLIFRDIVLSLCLMKSFGLPTCDKNIISLKKKIQLYLSNEKKVSNYICQTRSY